MFKKIIKGNRIKYKFFGIPIKVIKWSNNTIKVKFLGITVWRIKRTNDRLKVYFCGFRIISVKDVLPRVVHISEYNPASNLKVKALEILNERKNISCEVKISNA